MAHEESTSIGSHGSALFASAQSSLILGLPDLARWPLLRPLTEFIDMVFIQAHVSGADYGLLPSTVKRVESGPQQLIKEIGPDGFCMILFEEMNGVSDVTDHGQAKKVIALGSAKPYKLPKEREFYGSSTNMLFKRDPQDASGDGVDYVKWELVAFATDPAGQRQGLATQLTAITVAEIQRRVDEERAATKLRQEVNSDTLCGGVKPKIELMLSTMAELNEGYYLKKGWKTTSKKNLGPGTEGSKYGFSIAEMVKVLE